MAHMATIRISKEIRRIQNGTDLSLAVACQDSNLSSVNALIVGPPGTPYEYGFFDFAIQFGSDYPTKPPKVTAKTTNGGRCRFNPNIYAAGKVCLSILGTWRGEAGEGWSPVQSLESILLSIQSLMSSNPYENEPGFENATEAHHVTNQEAYTAKIRHETIRIAVIQRLEGCLGTGPAPKTEATPAYWDDEDDGTENDESPSTDRTPHGSFLKGNSTFEPFTDLCKRRLLWFFKTYLNTINVEEAKYKDGTKFSHMPFESSSNQMAGEFQYGTLKKRLMFLKETIEAETDRWALDGLDAQRKEQGTAANLHRQFMQLVEYNKDKVFHLELELADGNPFVWLLILYGKPTTKLEGGIFKIKVSISPRYPEEQPRATVTTPLFHHRVAEDGSLCYFVRKPDDMRSHVEAIMQALEEESVGYDPRTIVRPEASQLLWGTEDEKKQYYRRLRRSVESSVET